VESEKSAIIASCIMPELVWLAAGNLNGLSIEKCQVLESRDVMLYSDLGAFEKWSLKTVEISEKYNCKVTVSKLLEDEATDCDRANGLDIADYIITEFTSQKTIPEIQSFFSPALQSMIEKK
jgi:type I restriction enzyme R subunit